MGRYITPQSPLSASSHDTLLAIRDPGPGWVEQGTVQLQSDYPELFAKTGLLPDAQAGEIWTPFTPETSNSGAIGEYPTAFWLTEQTALLFNDAGSASKIFRTADGGMNWTQVHSGEITAVARLDGNTVLACAGTAILRSTDGGLTWPVVYDPSNSMTVWKSVIRFSPSRLLVFGVFNGSVLQTLISTDNGETFAYFNAKGIAGSALLSAAVFSPSTAIVVGRQFGANQLVAYRTVNGGDSWGTMSGFTQGVNCCAALTDKIGLLANSSGIHRTIDAGATWAVSLANNQTYVRDLLRIDNNTVVAVGYRSHMSLDNGETWIPLPSLNLTTTNNRPAAFSIPNGPAFVLDGYQDKWHRSLPAYNYDPDTHFRTARVMEGIHAPLKVYQRAG